MSRADQPSISARIEATSPAGVALVTLVMASIVSVAALGWPPVADQVLPHEGAVRDVVRERATADAALSDSAAESDHLRIPSAVVLLLPTVLFPEDYLTWSAALVGVASVTFLVVGSARLAGRRGLILAVAVPTSVAYTQGVLHGAMFVLLAALLTWTWVLMREGRGGMAGVLLGIVGGARLWPFLILVPLILARRWRVVRWALATFVGLTLVGLALPGVSWESTLASFTLSSERWIPAAHNASLAGWLDPLGQWAALVGFVTVIAIWAWGFLRIRSLESRVAWSLPAAILASPLAWMPYLLVLAPVVARYGDRRITRELWVLVYALLLFGYVFVPNKVVTTVVALVAMVVVAVEGDETFERLNRDPAGKTY